jgi:geranylgeranyl diphosphate synthase type II
VTSRAAALVRDVLNEYADLVRLRLRQRLRDQRLPVELHRIASDYPERGGRALRAGLCLATAQAHGASAEQALESAVSIELMHNAFLIHDDIEDESQLRRGRPTLQHLHGVASALNAGDALLVMGLAPLLDNCRNLGPRLSLRILREAQRMARETVEGQALELAWRSQNRSDLDAADYLHMIFKKTCWYTTIYPCRVGGLIGTHGRADPDRFLAYGFFVGAAFQVQDDLLNLGGEQQRYGKELNGDLREGKRTLMLLHLLQTAPVPIRRKVRRFLAQPRQARSDAEVSWLREAMLDSGAIEHARAIAQGLAGAAERECQRAFGSLPPSRPRGLLEALPRWVIERS